MTDGVVTLRLPTTDDVQRFAHYGSDDALLEGIWIVGPRDADVEEWATTLVSELLAGGTEAGGDHGGGLVIAEKIVYSRTLTESGSARTRIEREFDPAAVRRLKVNAEQDITVAGPELAAQAVRAGLVDEFQMIVSPVIVGGGKRFLPDGVRLDLDLVEDRQFGNGVVVLRYAAREQGG